MSFWFKSSNVDETNTVYHARRLSVSLSRCSKAPRLGLHDPRATCSTRALKVWGLGGDARSVWGAAALVLRPHQRPPRRRRTLPRLPYAGAEARGRQRGGGSRVMGGGGTEAWYAESSQKCPFAFFIVAWTAQALMRDPTWHKRYLPNQSPSR